MAAVVAQSHFTFGLRTGVSNNLCFFDEQTVVFPCGNNCVCYNTVQRCQRFIPGRLDVVLSFETVFEVTSCLSHVVLVLIFLLFPFMLSPQAQRRAGAHELWPSAPTGVTWQCQSVARRPPSRCSTCSMSRAEREKS